MAPDFSLTADDGSTLRLTDLLARGRNVIVYFYPAAMTPGCTAEACDFRDNLNRLTAAGYEVVGISKDEPSTLARFRERDHLTFPLLSDPDCTVHRAYGAYGERKLYGKGACGGDPFDRGGGSGRARGAGAVQRAGQGACGVAAQAAGRLVGAISPVLCATGTTVASYVLYHDIDWKSGQLQRGDDYRAR